MLIQGPSTKELIEQGYLCPFKLFAAKNAVKADRLKSLAGDYNQRELAELVDASLTVGDVIETWLKYASGKRTVVFCVDVAHSRETARAYIEQGVAAEHLDGETPSLEREAILERFRNGTTLVLCNCGIVSEGVDIPGIEAVQILRPTRSLSLHLQMIGRGLRPFEGKTHLIILDHTQNWIFHGLPDEQHEWSLEPLSLSHATFAIQCEPCDHCFRPSPQERKELLATCPNCGTEVKLKPPGEGEAPERNLIHDESQELEEISLALNQRVMAKLQYFKEVQEQRNYSPWWVYINLFQMYPDIGLSELRECAKLLGFKPGWAFYRWKELQDNLQDNRQQVS